MTFNFLLILSLILVITFLLFAYTNKSQKLNQTKTELLLGLQQQKQLELEKNQWHENCIAEQKRANDLAHALSSIEQNYAASQQNSQLLNQQILQLKQSINDKTEIEHHDHKEISILLALWGEHLTQATNQQSGRGDEIVGMLNAVSEEVKTVVSDLDISKSIHRLVELIREGRSVLVDMLTLQGTGATEKRGTLQALDKSVEQIQRVQDIVGVMHNLTFTTQLLASNASVSAARASGEEGRAFKVIAQRMAEFAQEISASAKEIGQVVVDFRSVFDHNMNKVREQMQSDLDLLDIQGKQVAGVMENLVGCVGSADHAGGQLSGALAKLETNVGTVVRNTIIGMQYQDRIRQVLEHVADSLRHTGSYIETGSVIDIETLLKEEMAKYTTQEERELYRSKLTELGFTIEEKTGEAHVIDGGGMMFF
jgi:hypothetical protein